MSKIKESYDNEVETSQSRPGEVIWQEMSKKPQLALLSFLPSVGEPGSQYGYFERTEATPVSRILSYLAQRGYPVAGTRINLGDEEGLEKFVTIVASKPELQNIGISAFTFEIPWAQKLARALRDKRPDIKLILGGPHADTALVRPEDFEKYYRVDYDTGERLKATKKTDGQLRLMEVDELERLFADFDIVAKGAGEVALDTLLSGKKHEAKIHRKYLQSKVPEKSAELDDYYELLRIVDREGGFYPLPEDYHGTITYPLSEGCPNSCTFCTSPITCERKYASREDNIEETVASMQSRPENLVWFDSENVQPKTLRKLCQLMKGKDKYMILMLDRANFTTPDQTELSASAQDDLRSMEEAGVLSVTYGVESIDEKIAADLNKPISEEITNKVLEATSDAGIIPRAMMVFGEPNEDENTLRNFIEWAKKSPAFSFRIGFATPYQGTPLWRQANRENLWISDEIRTDLESHTSEKPLIKCRAITVDGTPNGEVDLEKLEQFRQFPRTALTEVYNSPEYHQKVREFAKKHPDRAIVLRGLIYLFEKQGLVPEGSFDQDFEQSL